MVMAACSSRATPTVVAITACPQGAELIGDAPPKALRQRCQKSEGVRHGASREWYEDHSARTSSEWWDGNKHGRFTLWFKNGRIRSEGAHRHGAPAGKWKFFNEDGSLREERSFPVEPPPADWLAQALAGHPPADAPPRDPSVPAGSGSSEEESGDRGGW